MNTFPELLFGQNSACFSARDESNWKSDCASVSSFPRPGLLLLLLVLCTSVIHLFTLGRSPTVWIDEVMILDYGRVLINPNTDWAVTTVNGHPARPLSPLYCVAEWSWVSLLGYTPDVSRTFAMVWAGTATLAFFWLLKDLKVNEINALWIAFAFFCDVVLTGSFRGARGDSCALAFVFLACLLWYQGISNMDMKKSFLSGIFAALAFLSWPTAFVTLTLMVGLYLRELAISKNSKPLYVFSCVTGLLTVLIVWLIIYKESNLLGNIFMPSGVREASPASFSVRKVVNTVIGCYRYTPWVVFWTVLAVLISVLTKRGYWLLITFIGAIAIACSVPPFYRWRLIYLTPFLYLLIADGFGNKVKAWHLALALAIPSFAVSVAGRAVTAVIEWEGRDHERWVRDLREIVPDGSTVLMDGYTPYYAGLRAGWKMHMEKDVLKESAEDVFVVCERDDSFGTQREGWIYLRHISTNGVRIRDAWRSHYEATIWLRRAKKR